MERTLKLVVAALAIVVAAGCATAAGGMIGAGIGSTQDNTAAGAMIGAGIGMMIDVMD